MLDKLVARTGGGAALMLASLSARADLQYNLQPPATNVASQIYNLHLMVLWVCLGIFVVVFGAMFYSILRHRKSLGHKAANFHENTLVEITWTVIPFIILMAMAYPASKTVLDMKNTSDADMTIKVTGYQWKWGYNYLGQGVNFFSNLSTPRSEIENLQAKDKHYLLEVDHPMVVPTGEKIKLLITSNDVIHGWYLPAFGIQQDAIPGFVKSVWFKVDEPGTYRGQCAQLCGKDHGFMPIVVKAVSPQDFTKWIQAQKAVVVTYNPNKTYTEAELVQHGAQVYAANCAACHQANGKGIPGAFPALDGDPIVNGPKAVHIETVLNGKGGRMPAWKDQLNDFDIASVITYERNSWGNHTGEAIQPAEVKALRK
ncbi:MAG TPA: cytochrome c oxidase subunit II [Burkholderiales bacterium]|nr:cytochrome c oxidase subunit II [Burkholderiales bacterium]